MHVWIKKYHRISFKSSDFFPPSARPSGLWTDTIKARLYQILLGCGSTHMGVAQLK